MEKAGSILSSIFKNIGIEDRLTLARLQREWPELFEAPLSLHTCPSSLNNGSLSINVDSPLWLQQLKFFKQAMLSKLETHGINSITFKHGRTNLPSHDRARSCSGQNISKESKLDAADTEWIEQTLSDIDDTELQDTIRSVIEKALLKNVKRESRDERRPF